MSAIIVCISNRCARLQPKLTQHRTPVLSMLALSATASQTRSEATSSSTPQAEEATPSASSSSLTRSICQPTHLTMRSCPTRAPSSLARAPTLVSPSEG